MCSGVCRSVRASMCVRECLMSGARAASHVGFRTPESHGLIGNLISAGWSRDETKVEHAAFFCFSFYMFFSKGDSLLHHTSPEFSVMI